MDLEDSDLQNRTQFDKSYNINFRDGDMRSSRSFSSEDARSDRADAEDGETQTMYKSPNLNNINRHCFICSSPTITWIHSPGYNIIDKISFVK